MEHNTIEVKNFAQTFVEKRLNKIFKNQTAKRTMHCAARIQIKKKTI